MEDIQYKIEQLENYLSIDNLKNLSIEKWKLFLSKELSSFYSTRSYNIDFKWLYRARPNFITPNKPVEFFHNSNDLWAPPKRKVKYQGRCNLKGQSLLYCSTHITTSIFETKPKANTDFTIMEYKSLGNIGNLAVVGVNKIMNIADDYFNIFGSHFNEKDELSIELDLLLSKIFKSKKTNSDEYQIYNLTNAITQIYLNNQKMKGLPKSRVAKRNIGLMYPSVETNSNLGLNIVLNPLVAKQILKPFNAYKYRVIDKPDKHHYVMKLTHQTKKIQENGELIWRSTIDSTTEYITDIEKITPP